MNDKDIILNHINNNYTFHCEEHKTYRNSNISLGFVETNSKVFKTLRQVINEITVIYGDFLMDNGKLIHEEITEWFEEEKNKKFKKIYEILDNLTLEHGNTTWVAVDENSERFDYKTLISLDVGYSIGLVKLIYEDWLLDEVSKKTEEIMGFN